MKKILAVNVGAFTFADSQQKDVRDGKALPAFAAAVTPSDTADLVHESRFIIVGTTGNLVVDVAGDGTTVTLSGVRAGKRLPIKAKRIRATGTTATNIVELW